MFKLKLINKPVLLKLKCNFSFPPIILAKMQEKEIVPTKKIQEILPDQDFDGLSKVVVDKIPEQYIIPDGNLEISQNGTFDVTDKVNAVVNVPEKKLGAKTITTNGTYKATDDNLDGYSEVEVATSGVDINEYFADTISGGSQSMTSSGWAQCAKKFRSPLTISGSNANYMFYNYPFEKIPILNGTGNITDSRWMFYYCYAREMDLSNFDTSNITWMNYMFQRCQKITSLNLSSFDTSNVTIMSNMFDGCVKLTNLDLSGFNTSKVTNMATMFSNCSVLTSLNLSSFDTSNVISMDSMFNNCSSLTNLDLSNFDTSNVTSMYHIFFGCSKLENLNISNFDFTKITNYNAMFNYVPRNCYILVKDAASKEWITTRFTNLTNVHYVGEEG